MRRGSKSVLLLALLGLLALGLSACGGSSEDSTAGSTAAPQGSTASPASGKQGAGKERHESTAAGSASFRVEGGDNSIQNYGEEADGSEVAAATAALDAYLEARAAGDWSGQCAA